MGCNMYRYFASIVNSRIAAIGIGSMVVFIALVLVAGMAASVLIQTGNKLEIQTMRTSDQTTADVSTGIRVTDIEGHNSTRYMPYNRTGGLWWNATRNDGSQGVSASGGHGRSWYNYSRIHNLTITITPRAGSGYIDLSTMILEISNSTVKCILKYMGSSTDPNYANAVGTSGVFATMDSTATTTSMFNQRANSFGIIEIEDADGSSSASNPVINRGDMMMLCINMSACFWGVDERTDIWGTLVPEEGATTLFEFTVRGFTSDTVYDFL